ncbi:hypothetical protein MMC31_001063 [Peltigera leucophlebia]|nr:hypothetical protein [Peltigera leucophlebia]
MDTRDQKNDLKGLGTITTPALIVGGAKDVVDDFLFAVSYKEKDFLVPTYMANAMNKLLHDLAEIKEKCMAQLKKERHHSTHNVGNHTVATYGTTEDVAAKLNNIIISLLEKSRETPIDVGPGQPHMTIEEALKTSELEIMQDNFLSDVLKWMAAHPYATAFHIAMALLMLCPGLAVVPLLEMVGFGGEGIIAGSVAASYQSVAGPIAARSLFAVLQSTAMGGYGVFKVYAAVRAAIALAVTFEVGRAKMQHGCREKLSLIPPGYGEIEKERGCAACVIQ